MKYYAGIGSRETPDNILGAMTTFASLLHTRGYWLRSGAAKGADTAFQYGASDNAEIFTASDATPDGIALAGEHHPAWHKCNTYVRKLHGRNSMIILGQHLDSPVEFVICWTPHGEVTGGTGLGMRLAMAHEIPIYNLAKAKDFSYIQYLTREAE
jgi:hypothetical protein